MLKVYDQLFSHREFSIYKGLWGCLNYFKDQIEIEFTTNTFDPLLYILGIEVHHDIPEEQVSFVIDNVKKNKSSKIIIDTTLEDFVKDNFFELYDKLCNDVGEDKIIILTSSAPNVIKSNKPLPLFKNMIYWHAFETNLYVTENEYKRPPAPRQCKKHFIALNKNARPLRNVFHSAFTKHNLIEKSYYAWHNIGLADHWKLGQFSDHPKFPQGSEILWLIERFDLEGDVEKLKQPIRLDHDFAEWQLPDECLKYGAVFCAFDTTACSDNIVTTTANMENNIYLSEKTFKPFLYSIPSMHYGFKNVLDEISNIGYINFNDYFNTNYKHSCNEETLLLHIKTTTMIADLEMDDLNDILNGKECMSMLEHNYEQFQKQDQFFKLVDDLRVF